MPAYTSGSPTGNNLELGISIVLRDRFSNQAREASSTIRKLHQDAKNAVSANLQAANSMSIVGMATAAAWGHQIKNVIQEGADFIDVMTTVKVVSQATHEESQMLSKTAKSLGESTMLYARDVASGMKYLAMAGADAKTVNDMITSASNMAVATGMELGGKGGTADLLTNIMHSFGLMGKSAANAIGDQLTKAALSSNISMFDLAESIKYAAADMVNLKQQLPQVSAMIGTLGNAGIQASMAGTALSNMARYFNKSVVDPNYKGNKALASIGLSKQDFIDAQGDLLDFGVILEKIKDATSNMASTDRSQVMLNIFGVRGNRAAMVLMNNLEQYRGLLGKITHESQGFTEKIVAERMSTLAGSLDKMVSTLENVRIAFAESLGPVLIPIFNALTVVIGVVKRVFEIPVIGTFISSFMLLGVAVLGVGSALTYLRTKWLILKNDSQVSGANMFSLLMGGWDGARIKAERYMAVERAIIAQRNVGVAGNTGAAVVGGVISTIGSSYVAGGVKAVHTKGKGGNAYMFYKKNEKGKYQRVSNKLGGAEFAKAAGNMSPDAMTNTVMAGAAGSIGKGVVKLGGAGLLKGLVGVGGRILSFLGGPWGMALGLIATTVGPALIRGLRGNKDATEESTESLTTLTQTVQKDIDTRLAEKPDDKSLSLIEEMRLLVQSIQYWTSSEQGKPKVIQVYVDGKKATEQILDERTGQATFNTNTKSF